MTRNQKILQYHHLSIATPPFFCHDVGSQFFIILCNIQSTLGFYPVKKTQLIRVNKMYKMYKIVFFYLVIYLMLSVTSIPTAATLYIYQLLVLWKYVLTSCPFFKVFVKVLWNHSLSLFYANYYPHMISIQTKHNSNLCN